MNARTGLADLSELQQFCYANGDIGCGQRKAAFEVIGAEHDNQKIDGIMAFQHHFECRQSIFVSAFDGIVMKRGAARMSFFDHMETLAKCRCCHSRPALLGPKPSFIIQGCHRQRSMRVGIAETDHCLLYHFSPPPHLLSDLLTRLRLTIQCLEQSGNCRAQTLRYEDREALKRGV